MKIEDRIRTFAHYLGCQVAGKGPEMTLNAINANTGCISQGTGNCSEIPVEDCKLILKPLSSISKIDAQRCAELAGLPSSLYKTWQVQQKFDGKIYFCFPGIDDNYRNVVIFSESTLSWKQVDYLRSQGYAIGLPKELYREEISL